MIIKKDNKFLNYINEDEYLCYLNKIIYNLDNKIGIIFNFND